MRSPVHVVYGGAHLFNAGTAKKLGQLALRALDEHYSEEVFGVSEDVIARVRRKLERAPVEDLRIDFEDGFGVRSDEEEDAQAERTAKELPAERDYQCGIRIKSGHRGTRTLAKFLDAGGQPEVVTLPKVTTARQVEALALQLEPRIGIGIELMVEDVRALLSLEQLVAAADGRCVSVHLGTYDLTASAGIIAPHQKPDHSLVDFARNMMLVSLAGTGVRLSDGATTTLPIGDRATIHRAWRQHFHDVRRHMSLGLYQGWDLHPAQLVSRFAAVFSFYREALPEMQARLRAFREAEERASRVGEVFDDAATGRGLTEFFARGIACGALDQQEPEASAPGQQQCR